MVLERLFCGTNQYDLGKIAVVSLYKLIEASFPTLHIITTTLEMHGLRCDLAVILDLCSPQVIGWAMSNSNNTELVQNALTMAIWRRGKVNFDSDQGSTYASSSYRKQLERNDLICSMARKGECLDNAVAASFFGSLKNEWVDHEDYRTRRLSDRILRKRLQAESPQKLGWRDLVRCTL